MPFQGDVVVRELNDKQWTLEESITYRGRTDTFVLPAGFRTDFASVPRALVWLLPRYGRYTKAAILHDYLWHEADQGRFNRSDADGIFRRSMRELEVPFVRRWMMWAAVRVGSWTKSSENLVRPGLVNFLLVLAVGLPTVVFIAVPVLVIALALALFWVVELVFFVILALGSRLKPPAERKQVNKPDFSWSMS